MATRLYFSSGQASAVNPGCGGWGNVTEALRRAGLRNKESGEALALGTQIGPWTVGLTALDRQFVYPPMSAGISFSGVHPGASVFHWSVSSSSDNFFWSRPWPRNSATPLAAA